MENLKSHLSKSGFVVLRNLVDHQLCDLVVYTTMLTPNLNNFAEESSVVMGGAVECYGSPHGDALLLVVKDYLESHGMGHLNPTYSFFRTYTEGCILVEHTDRPSCQISVTLALSQNDWEFECVGFDCVKNTVTLNKGDAVLYFGEKTAHGRTKPLRENVSHHIFLHFCDDSDEYKQFHHDGRKSLGMSQ